MGSAIGKSMSCKASASDSSARKITLGVEASDIAIVTPYQAQVSLLSASLHDDFPEMTIGSVDGLQGQEREVRFCRILRAANITGNYFESRPVESHWRGRFPR